MVEEARDTPLTLICDLFSFSLLFALSFFDGLAPFEDGFWLLLAIEPETFERTDFDSISN